MAKTIRGFLSDVIELFGCAPFTFDDLKRRIGNDCAWSDPQIRRDLERRVAEDKLDQNDSGLYRIPKKPTRYSDGKPILAYGTELARSDELQRMIEAENITTYQQNDALVELTRDNLVKINRLFEQNRSYNYGFTEIVFNHLSNEGLFDRQPESYRKMMRIIDIENSTQMNKHPDEFESIYRYIVTHENDVYNKLVAGDINLVDELIEAGEGDNVISFCSKFCKYMSNMISGGTRFDYCIYDFYVKNILPFYLEYFYPDNKELYERNDINISSYSSNAYRDFYKLMKFLLDEVVNRNESPSDRLTFHDLDRIMWYAYRNYSK